ncbi:DUF4199 domain-containing protein [Flavobacteriaceae bacterium LMO-SS05]|jgi:hypothetical protein
METQKPTVGKFAMNYGVILGAIMILIAVVMYVTGMALEGKQWPQYLYYIIFPMAIFYAIGQFKKQNANVLSLGEAIKLGVVIAAISAIVYIIYGLLFNYVIDPDFMNQLKDVVRDKMLEAPNTTQEMIDQQMKVVDMFMNPLIGNAIWLAVSMFFGLIYSLIGGLVMKKE